MIVTFFFWTPYIPPYYLWQLIFVENFPDNKPSIKFCLVEITTRKVHLLGVKTNLDTGKIPQQYVIETIPSLMHRFHRTL